MRWRVQPWPLEGDRLRAAFTVRNGSGRGMRVEVGAEAAGIRGLASRSVDLAAGESKEIAWPVGRSFYFRDPDGNLLELADADIWPR